MVAAAAAPGRLVVSVGRPTSAGCIPGASPERVFRWYTGCRRLDNMTAAPVHYQPTYPQPYPQPLPAWQLEQALNGYCAHAARQGWVVTNRTATTATLNGPALHIPMWVTLLLLVPTLGLFAALARAAARRIRWRQVWVDRYGRVCVQNGARGI